MHGIFPSLFFLSALWVLQGTPAVPQGFGRFGRIHDDGLLTLTVTPTGFQTPSARTSLRMTFGDGTGTVTEVVRINSTEKVLRVSGGGEGAPTEIRYTLLYPGFSATFGMRMELQSAGAAVSFLKVPDDSGTSPLAILVAPSVGSVMPIEIAFRPGFSPTASHFSTNGTVTIEAAEPIGEVRFLTPWGLREITPSLSAEDRQSLLQSCLQWASRPVPILEKRQYDLSADDRSVSITEQFRSEWGAPVAPVPPVLAFAIDHGYPAQISGGLTRSEAVTLWGPYAFVPGPRVHYSLPIPPTDERGYVRGNAPSDRVTLLNSLVGHLGGTWASNAVDLAYAGMTNAQMAWAYLTSTTRTQVTTAWKQYLPLGFRLPPYTPQDLKKPWKTDTEPLTGLEYFWTYFIDGPGGFRYDIEWGNGLPLYGLYKYAQYTGDWAFVRARWNEVQRLYRYIDQGDDWAWMTVVNADHGYSTGTGDPMDAAYGGTLACLKMARALGDCDAERHFAYKTARIAVPVVARFPYTAWAREQGILGPTAVALGFQEREGFTQSNLTTEAPWWITTLLSGDGVMPELFDLLAAYAEPAVRAYETEYASGYPAWYDGTHVYPFATIYNGNSVYVVFPHIYLRALLGEPTPSLWTYVDGCQSNRNNAWIGPNVLAEILARDTPLILTEWQPAAYRDGVVATDGRRVTLDFHLNEDVLWSLGARMLSGRVPARVRVGGSQVPFALQGDRLVVQVRASGDVRVEIELLP